MPASSRVTSRPRSSRARAAEMPAGPEPITTIKGDSLARAGPRGFARRFAVASPAPSAAIIASGVATQAPLRISSLRTGCHGPSRGGWLDSPSVGPRTVEEFGAQWSRFEDLGGDFGSAAVLQDLCGPLLSLEEIAGLRVVEIGSGNGRIVNMLLDAGAEHVIAVEPSTGIEVLRRNTRGRADRVTCLQTRGESMPDVGADL